MKKRIWVFLIIIALLLIGGGGYYYWQQAASQNRPKKVLKSKIKLVAIGDSLTQGVGDQKQQGGYVGIIKHLLANQYHNQVITYNYGKSGDRSDQILQRLHNQSIIQHNLKPADVIVMTVGGNDLSQVLYAKAPGKSANQVETAVQKAGISYRKKLRQLMRAIRQENKTAPIFVISIYNPYYVYFPNVTTMENSVTIWNHYTQATVQKYQQTYFVNIQKLMSYGQYTSASSRSSLGSQTKQANQSSTKQSDLIQVMNTSSNLNNYISPSDNYHPNYRGYTKMAQALLKVMKQHNQFEYRIVKE
ncbi:SGNH/GDSL hydrolase family protein [uncultured Limosilactobacillus sp.]|uniref:SGNH/GDSL hydrolase family protein n=1 Tax=uncultured Limosilactobacillus sp. TaxID=2837629 RepID=UPI0025D6A021|nr:SGNH/GDSL hydrolase family protein [uncultured Limosilactobacillus sp.]